MFHVLLVLPVLAAFGAAAGVILAVMFALLGLAFFLELLLGLFCRTLRWLLWLPAAAGALGLVLSLLLLLPLGRTVILLFWGLFGLMLLSGWGVACFLKWAYQRNRG